MRAHVVLIRGKITIFAVAHQVIDPRAIKPGVDGKPAMEKDHNGCTAFGLGVIGLKDPVRPRALADLIPLESLVRRLISRVVSSRPPAARG